MKKNVVVFSQPGRIFCGKVKEFLSQNNIEFTDRNIATDETALKELEKLGYMTTPVTVISMARSWWVSMSPGSEACWS